LLRDSCGSDAKDSETVETGQRVAHAKCTGSAPNFTCGVELETARDYGFDYPLRQYRGCLAVTAKGKAIRWKATFFWKKNDRPGPCGALAVRP